MQQDAENYPPASLLQTLSLPAQHVPMIYNRTQKKEYTKYNSRCVHGLSISLIVLGIVCIVVQFADFFFLSDMKIAFAGIWGGLFFILTGTFGVVSSEKCTASTIVTFMGLCIIGSVLGMFLFGVGAIGLGSGIERDCPLIVHCGYGSAFVNGIMMIASFTSVILMFISSAIACTAVCPDCCRKNPEVLMGGQEHDLAGQHGETQVLIMPENQAMARSSLAPSTATPSGYMHTGQPDESAF